VPVEIKPCSSGMCEMVSAAKHCRDIRVWFARSVSAPMDVSSGSSDQTVRLWDVQIAPASEPYKDIRVGFGQSRLAQMDTPCSGSSDQTVRLWDVQDGTCLRTLQDIQLGLGSRV